MSKAPKLRFPKFEGEWEEKELGEVGGIITGKTPSTKEEDLWNGDILFVTPTDINESKYQHSTERTVKKTDKMNVLPEKSVMVTCIASIGKMSLSTKPSITNQQINSIVPYKEISDNEFLYYAILKDIDKIKASQSSSTVPIINKAEFAKINTFIPSIAEQQKIADCLSALDEEIVAEEESLGALKAYKKGLLQQLFPEGVSKSTPPLIFNKLPKLRFKGFEGEWEEVKLGEICNITNGKANVQDHIEGGRYPLFDRSEVVKASNEYFLDCETVILPGEGIRFTPKYYKGKFNLHQRAYALKEFSCSGLFLYYAIYAKKDLLATKAVQSTVLSLRLPILQNFEICIPVDIAEQEKIANCLSSLDELIEAKNEKIKLLKSYKKGLLQQMFVN